MKRFNYWIAVLFMGMARVCAAAETDTPTQDLPGMSPSVELSTRVVESTSDTPATETAPIKPRTGLNEMKGKVLSISYDPKTLRLATESGISVEFTYDKQTSMVSEGAHIKSEDLEYNDVLIVRYAGKDLYAVEVERLSKAQRPH